MTPSVTVVMPVYNGLPYLKEAIQSVLNQTFTDFEFLIIDDGSTDASVACIESYRDSRIRFVRNEKNMGQAHTLNHGLELARGEYIARLDQDDVCLPDRLQEQMAYMDARPDVAITCTWEHTIDEKGRRVRSWRGEIRNYGAFLGTILLGKCPVWHPSAMFKRQVALTLGGYDPSYAPSDDLHLWARIALERYNAAFVPKFLVLQRVHGAQQSVKRLTTMVANVRRIHEQVISTLYSGPETNSLAALLRMDGTFWKENQSSSTFRQVLIAFETMLANAKRRLHLEKHEYVTLEKVIVKRLGLGFKIARAIKSLPAPFLYTIFISLSPLTIPAVRSMAAALNSTLYKIQYPRRYLAVGLERLMKLVK